ncbi:hypothetical protein P3T36_006418 [Kitasatospora sp. MAP12-15]|nr:hypothetical protein [Kitasatospora sp. MAP12-44]
MSSVPADDLAAWSREPICSFGKWLFVPDRRNAAGDVRTGYLTCNGERVVLAHCSRLLADLLRTIRQLEQDFAAQCGVDTMPARA